MIAGNKCYIVKGDWGLVAIRRTGVDCDNVVAFDNHDGISCAKVFRDIKGPKGLETVPIIIYVYINSSIQNEAIV